MNGEILILSLKTDESRVRLSSAKSFQNDIAAILVVGYKLLTNSIGYRLFTNSIGCRLFTNGRI